MGRGRVGGRSVVGAVVFLGFLGLHACSASYVTATGPPGGDAAVDGSVDAVEEGPTTSGPEGGDAASCSRVTVMALPSHGGPACPTDGSACYPANMSSFAPTWVPPLAGTPHKGVCSASAISDVLEACLSSSSTQSGCSSWEAANQACTACLFTDVTASSYGAMIVSGTESLANLPACIALAEPCNMPCALAVQADRLCSLEACNPSEGACASSETAYDACFSIADVNCGCTAFGTAANQCLSELEGAPAAHPSVDLCAINDSDFNSRFTAVAAFLCGD